MMAIRFEEMSRMPYPLVCVVNNMVVLDTYGARFKIRRYKLEPHSNVLDLARMIGEDAGRDMRLFTLSVRHPHNIHGVHDIHGEMLVFDPTQDGGGHLSDKCLYKSGWTHFILSAVE